MEEWQKEHIRKNLVELIKSTICYVDLIAQLTAKNVLTKADVDVLEVPSMTQYNKAKKLYDILETRVGAYDILLWSLEKTKQSGAANILKEHDVVFRNFGTISYDKNHVLGTGSSGTKVFKGFFAARDVAVKVLNTDCVNSELAIREVNILRKLDSHQNIIRYFIAESQDNFIYIALELCVISLHDEVTLNLVNMNKEDILRQCTEGLAHLHKNNVIHGDLKPANILLTQHQQVKLSDFGMSKQIQPDRTHVSTTNVGTHDWLAPEILKPVLEAVGGPSMAIKVSYSADIFSLGCVYHFTLTSGLHPFGEIPYLRLPRILQYQPTIFEDITAQWKNAIVKMIASVPCDRPSAIILSTFFPAQITLPKSEKLFSCKLEEANRIAIQNRPPVDKTMKSVSKSANSTFEQTRKMVENTHLTNEAVMIQKPVRGSDVPTGIHSPEFTPFLDSKSKPVPTNYRFNLELDPEVVTTDHLIGPKTTTLQASHLVVQDKPQDITVSENCLDDNIKISDEKMVDLNEVDEHGNNALFRAVESELPLTRIRHLVESGVQWKGQKKKGEMILHVAARRGHAETIKYVLAKGAKNEIQSRDNSNQTPLLISSFAEKNFLEIVSVLIESGSDVKEVDKWGRNLVLFAVERRKTRSELEFLVDLGIPWNVTDISWGRNVLHIAASAGNVEAVIYFIFMGANIHAKDYNMKSPLLYSAEAKKNFKEMVSALVKAGSDVNAVDIECTNLLLLAARKGSIDELEEIIKLGVPWQSTNEENETVLHYAVKGGNVDAVKYFISRGADVKAKDSEGSTPLHCVYNAENNFEEIVTLLIANGAKINATDKSGHTFLYYVVQWGKTGKEPKRMAFVEKMGGVGAEGKVPKSLFRFVFPNKT